MYTLLLMARKQICTHLPAVRHEVQVKKLQYKFKELKTGSV